MRQYTLGNVHKNGILFVTIKFNGNCACVGVCARFIAGRRLPQDKPLEMNERKQANRIKANDTDFQHRSLILQAAWYTLEAGHFMFEYMHKCDIISIVDRITCYLVTTAMAIQNECQKNNRLLWIVCIETEQNANCIPFVTHPMIQMNTYYYEKSMWTADNIATKRDLNVNFIIVFSSTIDYHYK